MMIDRWLNSLFDSSLRRFGRAVQDVGQFVAEMHLFTDHVRSWRVQVRQMDEGKLAEIQNTVNRSIEELRQELRALATEMDVAEGKLTEAKSVGELAADRLATGEHMLLPENRKLLLEGDVAGLVEYLLNIQPEMYRRAIKEVGRRDWARLADQYQMLKGELGVEK